MLPSCGLMSPPRLFLSPLFFPLLSVSLLRMSTRSFAQSLSGSPRRAPAASGYSGRYHPVPSELPLDDRGRGAIIGPG